MDNHAAGLKAHAFDGELTVEGGLFWMRRDGIVTIVWQRPSFLPSNAGEHRCRGFESGLRWDPGRRVAGHANACFCRDRFGDFVIQSASSDTVLTDNRLPTVPGVVLSGGATISGARSADVAFDVKRLGPAQVHQGNTLRFSSYTLVDAAVSRERGPSLTALPAHKLFDKECFWNGDISRGPSARSGRPRQVTLTVSLVVR